jgi:glycosyl transferase family 25
LDIRVINLDRAPDRRENVETQFRKQDLAWTFFSAVDGQNHDLSPYRRFLDVNPYLYRPLLSGEIGCFASHYRLWEECVATQTPLLIFEDDCILDDDIKEVAAALPGLLETHPYIRLAGHIPRRGSVLRKLATGRSLARLNRGPHGTVAYAIAPAAAERLIRHADLWNRPVDNYIDTFWLHGVLPIAVQPYPVRPGRFPSMVFAGRPTLRYAQRRVHRVSRSLYRKTQTIRRWLLKLTPAWQQG